MKKIENFNIKNFLSNKKAMISGAQIEESRKN
jgi:hypothetical protein